MSCMCLGHNAQNGSKRNGFNLIATEIPDHLQETKSTIRCCRIVYENLFHSRPQGASL